MAPYRQLKGSASTRIPATVAVVVLALTTLLTAARPADAATRFRDVPASHQFRTEITWLAKQSITTGYADGTFRPKGDISREAFAAFLYRLEGSPTVTKPSRSPFKDVKPSDKFYTEIVWLARTGISGGWADGTFRPREPITREAMAAFLYRLAQSDRKPEFDQVFVDVFSFSAFYTEIDWLAAEGITSGYSADHHCREFRPKDAISREAAAAFLYRFSTGRGTPLTSTACEVYFPHSPFSTSPPEADCSDFETREAAQVWFLTHYEYYGDIARLDGDGDMEACESLPWSR